MPDANLFIDRRAHPRISLKLPVKYQLIVGQDEIKTIIESKKSEKTSQIMNVSLGGIYLVTGQVLNVDSLLRIQITLPKISHVISAFAEVVWSNNSGVGLHFKGMKEEDVDKLKNYLLKISNEKLKP